jgi:hypothetical protein
MDGTETQRRPKETQSTEFMTGGKKFRGQVVVAKQVLLKTPLIQWGCQAILFSRTQFLKRHR